MTSKVHIAIAGALLFAATAFATDFSTTDRFSRDFALSLGGSIVIENPYGSVDVVGGDGPGLSVSYQKITRAADKALAAEGREQVKVLIDGDERVRFIRTLFPPNRQNRWVSTVNMTVRVPKSVHVKITTNSSERIRLGNITGNVFVKNFAATISLDGVTGATSVETVNGNIQYAGKPQANVTLSTVNGLIEMRVAPDSNFQWAADTLKGDFLTNMPVRGAFNGSSLRGQVNAPGGPAVTTSSLMGNVVLLRLGSQPREAQSVRKAALEGRPTTGPGPLMVASRNPNDIVIPKAIQQAVVDGSFQYSTSLGNINIGEIRGTARLETGAGEVQVGSVAGDCVVVSLGGPLQLGDVLGSVDARTKAGDILVHAAREGGALMTGGGTIRLLYAGGPVTLDSGGGDIVLRQALAAVQAGTRSGDVTISFDPRVKSSRVQAKTGKGNVTVNVGPQFAGDVDITITTSDPDAHMVRSDFAGFSVKREQVDGKTRIHATGKINGGGEKLEIEAVDGGVQIQSLSSTPMTVIPTR